MTVMNIIEAQLKDPGGSVRAVSPVSPIQAGGAAVAQAASSAGAGAGDESRDSNQHEQAASAAEIARAYNQIMRIFSEYSSATDNDVSVDQVNGQITALLPPPVVDIPVPPASSDMVEYAVHSARQMAAQAALARAAQANVGLGAVEQILAGAS